MFDRHVVTISSVSGNNLALLGAPANTVLTIFQERKNATLLINPMFIPKLGPVEELRSLNSNKDMSCLRYRLCFNELSWLNAIHVTRMQYLDVK